MRFRIAFPTKMYILLYYTVFLYICLDLKLRRIKNRNVRYVTNFVVIFNGYNEFCVALRVYLERSPLRVLY